MDARPGTLSSVRRGKIRPCCVTLLPGLWFSRPCIRLDDLPLGTSWDSAALSSFRGRRSGDDASTDDDTVKGVLRRPHTLPISRYLAGNFRREARQSWGFTESCGVAGVINFVRLNHLICMIFVLIAASPSLARSEVLSAYRSTGAGEHRFLKQSKAATENSACMCCCHMYDWVGLEHGRGRLDDAGCGDSRMVLAELVAKETVGGRKMCSRTQFWTSHTGSLAVSCRLILIPRRWTVSFRTISLEM